MSSVLLLSVILFSSLCQAETKDESSVTLRLPDFDPMITQIPIRVCVSKAFQFSEPQFIKKIKLVPRTQSLIHTVLLLCDAPGFEEAMNDSTVVWDCDERTPVDPALPKRGYCLTDGMDLMAAESPPDMELFMPQGTGMAIPAKGYFVFLAHFLNRWEFKAHPGQTDDSGVEITVVPASSYPEMRKAGLLVMQSAPPGLPVPPHAVTHLENACIISSDEEIREMKPFAIWDHVHESGVVSSAWKVDHRTGEWSLIARLKSNDRKKRLPIENAKIVVRKGDIIATRCTLNRTGDANTLSESSSEPCVHLIYYTVTGDGLAQPFCVAPGKPEYKWATDPRLPGIPPQVDYLASHLD